MKNYTRNSFLLRGLTVLLFAGAILAATSCTKTVRVYYPPRLDLTQYGRLGMITFSDNAQPSVAGYVTEQFENQIHSAQTGVPILELGTEYQVLRSVGANQMDPAAVQKIGKKYKVSAIFVGNINYSDIKADVNLEDIADFKGSVKTTLNAILSAKLVETEAGATIWSNSTSWKRKLGGLSVSEDAGVSVGTEGYEDAYRKLVPDMVYDITRDFRGRYIRKQVDK